MLKSFFLVLYVVVVTSTINVGLEAHVKPVITSSQNGSKDHIIDRHWYNANPKLNTSVFDKSIKMDNLLKISSVALNKGKSQMQQNGMMCHEYTFNKPIGKSSSGKPNRTIRVITDPKRSTAQKAYVVTAFPVK